LAHIDPWKLVADFITYEIGVQAHSNAKNIKLKIFLKSYTSEFLQINASFSYISLSKKIKIKSNELFIKLLKGPLNCLLYKSQFLYQVWWAEDAYFLQSTYLCTVSSTSHSNLLLPKPPRRASE